MQALCNEFQLTYVQNKELRNKPRSFFCNEGMPISHVKTYGDGNCFFHALSIRISGSSNNSAKIRERIMNLIDDESQTEGSLIAKLTEVASVPTSKRRSPALGSKEVDKYANFPLDFVAAANLFQVNMLIFNDDNEWEVYLPNIDECKPFLDKPLPGIPTIALELKNAHVDYLCDDEQLETAPHPKCYPFPTGKKKCHEVMSDIINEKALICDTIESVANISMDMLEMMSHSNSYLALSTSDPENGQIQTTKMSTSYYKSKKGHNWEFLAAKNVDNVVIGNKIMALPKTGLLSFNPLDGKVRILEEGQLFKFHENMDNALNLEANYYLVVEIDNGKSVLVFKKKVLTTPVAQQSYKTEL